MSEITEKPLEDHIVKMQRMVTDWLTPDTYIARFPEENDEFHTVFRMPDDLHSLAAKQLINHRRDQAFLSDIVRMLDGPELTAALSHTEEKPTVADEPVGYIYNAGGDTISIPPRPDVCWIGSIPVIGTKIYTRLAPSNEAAKSSGDAVTLSPTEGATMTLSAEDGSLIYRQAYTDHIHSLLRVGEQVPYSIHLAASEKGAAALIQAALASPAPASEAVKPRCYVAEMKTSAGSDFFVAIKIGDRELTPHMFKEKWKADYEVEEWKWMFGQAEKPDLMAFGPTKAEAE
jgi:hypothetical protein